MFTVYYTELYLPPRQGDSGGALLAQDRELLGWSAVGIVSYQPGAECGTENYVVFRDQEVPRLDRSAVRPPPAPTLAPPPTDGVCVFIENMGRNYNVVRNLTV